MSNVSEFQGKLTASISLIRPCMATNKDFCGNVVLSDGITTLHALMVEFGKDCYIIIDAGQCLFKITGIDFSGPLTT